MLTQEDDVEIHALARRGWSVSAIARHTGRDRKTVRKYLKDACPTREAAASCLEPHPTPCSTRSNHSHPHCAALVPSTKLVWSRGRGGQAPGSRCMRALKTRRHPGAVGEGSPGTQTKRGSDAHDTGPDGSSQATCDAQP